MAWLDSTSRHMDAESRRVKMTLVDADQLFKSNMEELWVFAYGSLLWKTGFDYDEERTGFIRGFSRRFWQGNVTHRGKQNAPGRVATLVQDESGMVWGKAFLVRGKERVYTALDHLGARECRLGGYNCLNVPFICTTNEADNTEDINHNQQTQPTPNQENSNPETVRTIAFIASDRNPWYLGDSPLEQIAEEVTMACGHAGHNVEYVTRLADFTRQHMPQDQDSHLFTLDQLIRKILLHKGICLHCLINNFNNNNNNNNTSNAIDAPNDLVNSETNDLGNSETNDLVNRETFRDNNNVPVSVLDSVESRDHVMTSSVMRPVTSSCPIRTVSPPERNPASYFCCSDCHYDSLLLSHMSSDTDGRRV